MRRLEPLILGIITLVLIVAIGAWSAPVAAQTCRDPVSNAAGEPTDPERNETNRAVDLESELGSAAQPTSGTQSPVLSQPTFSQKLEAFFNLLRRYGFGILKGHRP